MSSGKRGVRRQPEPSLKSSWGATSLIGVLVVVCGTAAAFLLRDKHANVPLAFQPVNFSAQGVPVEVLEWDVSVPPLNFSRQVALRKLPVIFKNSPCTQWNATRLWKDIDYLKNHVALFQAMEHTGPEWMYEFPAKMLGTDKGLDLKDPPRISGVIDISFQGFLRRVSLRTKPSKLPQTAWRYLTALVPLIPDKGPLHKIEADALPRDFLSPVSATMENANVWLSGERDICHTHYDPGENFYFLLQGQQQVSIWSPSMWPVLHPFPYLHVRNRQSQVYLDNAEEFPDGEIRNSSATTVLLNEGDLLYIPPFFSYEITTLQASSLAVNVWSDSYEGSMVRLLLNRIPGSILQPQSADNLYKKPKRGESPAKVADEIALLSVYLLRALPAIFQLTGEPRPKQAASSLLWTGLVQTRYRMYQADFGCADKQEGEPTSTAHFRPETVCAKPSDADHHSKASPENIAGVQAAVKHTVNLFEFLARANPAARDIVLLDFIEQLSAYVVGPPDMCIYWRCLIRELGNE